MEIRLYMISEQKKHNFYVANILERLLFAECVYISSDGGIWKILEDDGGDLWNTLKTEVQQIVSANSEQFLNIIG